MQQIVAYIFKQSSAQEIGCLRTTRNTVELKHTNENICVEKYANKVEMTH